MCWAQKVLGPSAKVLKTLPSLPGGSQPLYARAMVSPMPAVQYTRSKPAALQLPAQLPC